MNPLGFTPQTFVKEWYSAKKTTSERIELYDKTTKVIEFLESKPNDATIKKFCTDLIKEFKNHSEEKEFDNLVNWIAENTSYDIFKWGDSGYGTDSEKFKGAYASFHKLYDTVKNTRR